MRAVIVTVFAVAACAALVAVAEEPKQGQVPNAGEQAWMKAMTPGPEHARLAKAAGNWKLKVTAWMQPGQPPTTDESTSERTMILGGRYLHDHSKGVFGGMPFEGYGITGFDNVDHKYHGTWVDNFGTGMMTMIGTCDEAKRTCTFTGEMNDPMTGKASTMRMVETWSADYASFTTEFYGPGPDGKEFLSMKMEGKRM